MSASTRRAVKKHRTRLKRRGVVRLEVRVRKDDVALVRDVVQALSDPQREDDTRAKLRQHLGVSEGERFKAFLAAAPLEGIDLTREDDFGRDVDL